MKKESWTAVAKEAENGKISTNSNAMMSNHDNSKALLSRRSIQHTATITKYTSL